MKRGSVEACEYGASILYSLAVNDDRKDLIGLFGGIRPLVWLLSKGTKRGRKDAVTTLFNLCLFPCNQERAVREDIVIELMIHLREPQGRMKDEALMLLDMIKSHHDTTPTLNAEDPVVHLVNIVWIGSQMNQEHATSILLHLCSGDPKHIDEAKQLGVERYLVDLTHFGSDGGKQKAKQLLEMISAHTEERKRARTQPNAGSGSGSKSCRARKMPNI
ncbi:hypothetical protein L2E82_00758 [Cichorium intybus]|uniref:Uncharacterized protein n=1 Tax=Cichorium intybus TaxID=13427 RepID=A0ACB9GYC0_CICIN|nr:hypothetical protein L2E82_00758 [Cichorium intybus]